MHHDYASFTERPDRDCFEQTLVNLIEDRLGKGLFDYINISFHRISNQDICQVQVERSPRPVYETRKQQIKFWVRTANGSRELPMPDAHQYISNHFSSRP